MLRAALHPDPARRLNPTRVRQALGEFALGHTPTVVLNDPTAVDAGPTAQGPAAQGPTPGPPPAAYPPHRQSAWGGSPTAPPPPRPVHDPAAAGQYGQHWQQAPVTPAPQPAQVPQQPAQPSGYEPLPAWARVPRSRPAVVGGWFLAVIGLGTLRPIWTVTGLVVVMALIGAVGVGTDNLRQRRLRYGPRRSDTARALAGGPWYLISGVLLTVPGLLVGGLAAVVIWGLGASRYPHTAVVALAIAVLTLLLWWIPSSTSARSGIRHLLAVLAPSARVAWMWAVAGLLVALVMVVAVVGFEAEVVWDPAPQPPVPEF